MSGWIVVVYLADGEVVREHSTKRAAKADGMAMRSAGLDAFVYSAADYALTRRPSAERHF